MIETLLTLSGKKKKLIFALPWTSADSLYDKFDCILRRAGMKTGPRDKFHKLRRTAATYAAVKNGIFAAMALLGHSEQYVTERYVDPTKLPGHDLEALLPPPELPEFMVKGGAA